MSDEQYLSDKKITYRLLLITTLLFPCTFIICQLIIASLSFDQSTSLGSVLSNTFMCVILYCIILGISGIAFIIGLIKVTKRIVWDKSISNLLICVPFIPIIIYGCCVKCIEIHEMNQLNIMREEYTVEIYIDEVKEKKEDHRRMTTDGTVAIDAFDYILWDIAEDNYWLHTRLQFTKDERKTLVDEAIPQLMEDLLTEELCYYIRYNDAGEVIDQCLATTIEYWEHKPNENTLIVKFSHQSEPDEFDIKYTP